MSKPENNHPAKEEASSLHMIATLAGVSIISGILIVLTVGATKARIEMNQREAKEKAVFQVLPGIASQEAFEWDGSGFRKVGSNPSPQATVVYAGYDAQGNLLGVAFEASSMRGYSGQVRVMCGYAPDKDAVVGFTVLQSLETPGLGDRINSDPQFLENFKALDMHVNAEQDGLANPIVLVKNGTKTKPWEIDGISGATVSSRAVTDALNTNCTDMAPKIKKHLDQLKRAN